MLSLFTFTYDRLLSGFQPKNSFYLSVYICADTLPLNLFRPKGTKRQKGHFSGHSPFISPHAKHEQMLVQLSVQFFRSWFLLLHYMYGSKTYAFFSNYLTPSITKVPFSPSLFLSFYVSFQCFSVSVLFFSSAQKISQCQ